jgi:hypothetical protein
MNSPLVKVQVRFVAKDRRDICDQPENYVLRNRIIQ